VTVLPFDCQIITDLCGFGRKHRLHLPKQGCRHNRNRILYGFSLVWSYLSRLCKVIPLTVKHFSVYYVIEIEYLQLKSIILSNAIFKDVNQVLSLVMVYVQMLINLSVIFIYI
jgi:hypothetical protein